MPTITTTLGDLERLAGMPCPIDGLEQRLELVKGEVKGYDVATDELRIELNDTNRPDLWSVEGIARQLRVHRRGKPERYPFFAKRKPGIEIRVEESVASVRPYVGGFLADGPTVTDELLRGLIETQEKLSENFGQRRRSLAIGIYPAAAIEFPVFYRAVLPRDASFTPLGFDVEMPLAEILERHPKGIVYGPILAGKSHYPLLVDARDAVLSFPPVINSREVGEVRVGDRGLFVEGTGTDAYDVLLALNILAANLSDRGATIVSCAVKYPRGAAPPSGNPTIVPYPLERRVKVQDGDFERLLGIDLSRKEITRGLRAHGCGVRPEKKSLVVSTPPYRFDYLHPVDAIEDYAISVGYNAFTPEMPTGFTVGKLQPLTQLERRVRDHLIGYAFEEVMTNLLTNRPAESEWIGRPANGLVEVANVMSESYSVLRRSLIPSLLRVEGASSTSQYPHRLFEVGECATSDPRRPDGSRTVSLAAALLGHATASFSELQSYLDRLFYDLGLEYRLEATSGAPFIEGRHAKIVVAGDAGGGGGVGTIGEIDPEILTRWNVRTPLAAFEIDLDEILSRY